jgi:hypothetical protein
MTAHWTLDTLPWNAFDASRINPDMLCLARAAALVEYGGQYYADYLLGIFGTDDAQLVADIKAWAVEEIQHGQALARWVQLADPSFDLDARYAAFRAGYALDLSRTTSVRGSKAGELIARCIVETGTSSYYTALADASDEPVFTAICRHIAADELRHYKLFYTHLQKALKTEPLSTLARLKVAVGRLSEADDDELAFAYHIGNAPAGTAYSREASAKAYAARAYSYYRPVHINRAINMIFKACGLSPQTLLSKGTSKLAWWGLCHTVNKTAANLNPQEKQAA